MNIFGSIFKSSKRYKLLLNTCIALLLINPAASSLAASNSEFTVSEAQSVDVTQEQRGDDTVISFSAFGQTFNLLMQENEALMKNYSSRLLEIDLFAGTIEGVSGSWARISKVDGQFSGAFYDGYELYMLDSGEMVSESVDASLKEVMQQSDTVVYKASGMTSTLICGDHDDKADGHDHSKFSYDDFVSELQEQQASTSSQSADFDIASVTATQQVNLSITADTQYVATSPNGAEVQILSQMNIIDGIFSEQVGVQFGIQQIDVLTDNGPLTSTDSGTLLRQYRTFVDNDNPGLSHLFSGRNIDGNVIGIAFVSAICTNSGVGVTQAGGRGTLGALTAAHEFGHNFGAPHDNQAGSACATSPGTFLMNPSLNGSDQFSQCSLDQIENTLNIASRNSCLVDVVNEPAPTPTVPTVPTVPTAPTPTVPTPTAPFASCDGAINFANGANGFTFINDTESPAFTANSVANSSLNVVVGGVDNADISNIEGTWRRQCQSVAATPVTIRVNGSLSQASEYEANEFSQIALRVNGNQTVFATLTGNGNGGPTQSTGAQEFTTTTTLPAGTNTIDLLCFNNLKTFNNESTTCSFTDIDIVPVTTAVRALSVNFNVASGGFSFEDDSSDPIYSDGNRITSGGVDNTPALLTVLGGVDNDDISNLEANWTRNFTTSGGSLVLTLDANLVQTSEYEANEQSEIGVIIDGQVSVLNTINGDGNGGTSIATGFQRYTVQLNNLSSGSHSISLFCRNSEKTFNNETTSCTFDNVIIQ